MPCRFCLVTPDALAALHGLAFDGVDRPWTAAEFAIFLGQEQTILVTLSDGFALGRIAGLEAELLMLAVHPEERRRGVGPALVKAFEAEAVERGAGEAFLEVAVDNAAACALYRRIRYDTLGRRPAYYLRGQGSRSTRLSWGNP